MLGLVTGVGRFAVMMEAVAIHDARSLGGGRFLAFDLIDVLRVALTDVLESMWRCRNVECAGPMADKLHNASEKGIELGGADLVRLAAGIQQVIDGDFEATRKGANRPWLLVRAIDSTCYVVVTKDAGFLRGVRQRFNDVHDSPNDAIDLPFVRR